MRNVDNSSGGGHGTQVLQPTTTKASGTATTQSAASDLDTIWSWNATVPQTISRCMHDLFVEQAQQRPEHLAVESWDGTLTYRQLDDLSTRLAHHLREQGVEIGTRVPLCFEKSLWAVVALVSVLKAGATVSLTDPSQPEARLRTIVEQTGAKLVITSKAQQTLGKRIASEGSVLAVSQSLFDTLPPASSSNPLPTVPPSSPMYIIFTSGSTGKPKGVVLSHENYTSGAIPRAEAVGYKCSSRVFDFPSYAFDVTYDCMLCTLVVGGTICVPSEEGRMNDLSGAIRMSRANMVHMTPSVARVLDEDVIPSLDVLGLGGEAVGASDAANWGQQTTLVIAYGPSECTVGCTINNTVQRSTGIGRGVGGVTWIVDPDDHNQLTPLGGVGELIVEGPVVGIGYLDEPEKTSQVFIEDPTWLLAGHGSVAGRHGRLYKTGDLVKYEDGTVDGSIEFVGRKDQQVKLRGQRVELAEVEHHVRGCLPTGVKVAAEVIKPEKGSPSLVAFLVEPATQSQEAEAVRVSPSQELAVALSKIESAMADKVPRYMIPASFITLGSMPSLVSGKTDRKKLREIGATLATDGNSRNKASVSESGAPATDVEIRLVKSWCRVLGGDMDIFRGSSFFSLGGDSLRAMRLISAARDEGLSLNVADVFGNPLLRDMATKAGTYTSEDAADVTPFSLLESDWGVSAARDDVASLCEVDEAVIEDLYPCTPLQEALMALSAKVKEAYVAQRVVDLPDVQTAERLIKAFAQAAQESHILRTRIVQVPGKGLFQVVVKEELDCHHGDDLQAYLASDRDTSMTLGKPLVRYSVINDRSSQKISFVLTMHHALYDGWSMPLVVERVNKAYHSQSLSRPADFRHFIRYLSNLDRSVSETYWRENLQGAYANHFPRLPYFGYQVKPDALLEEYVPLPQGPPDNTTIATLIRAGWALVASQYVGSGDVIFGETLTGRNAPILGVEEIEGPMITTIPFRVRIDSQYTVAEYLDQVQSQCIAQIPHEHFGLQHIRRLSRDALDACELGAGLVLHPSEEKVDSSEGSPADLLVPAGDTEAAQEALKFNTYALMLVCAIDPKGFHVMASFDSTLTDVELMQRVLNHFSRTVGQLAEAQTRKVEEIDCLAEEDLAALRTVLMKPDPVDLKVDGLPEVEGAYIVDAQDPYRIVPLGAPGKLIIRSNKLLDLPTVGSPAILEVLNLPVPSGDFYDVEKTAILHSSGSVSIVNRPTPPPAQAPRPKKQESRLSPRQRKLRSTWSRVLQVPEADIGLDDSFFLLGGDSIFAMKLVSEARAEGVILSVAQIFSHRTLSEMAAVMEDDDDSDSTEEPLEISPFELVKVKNKASFVEEAVTPHLADQSWNVVDAYPARPLQEIAVRGTTQIPRFSVRYEMVKFTTPLPSDHLRNACHELVARNEILRTVFVKHEQETYGVVLDHLETQFIEYDVDGDVNSFCHQLCRLDVMTKMPYGSSFVKWFYVKGDTESCLIFRISHAQYDEMCLPIMLRQLSSLIENKPVPETFPFSHFVGQVLKQGHPSSIPYWRELLAGASMTVLKPDVPVEKTNHFATEMNVDLTGWSKGTTIASLPTAAWALTLARRLAVRDVFFAEVVSGRNTSHPNSATVTGPCWQYLPFRLVLSPTWTGLDLLTAVEKQHASSSAHEGMALNEIQELCDLPDISTNGWFDSVVHQAVKPVESLDLADAGGKTETLYVHEAPLWEWNVQAFFGEGEMTVEVITVESWKEYAQKLLEEIAATARELVKNPNGRIFADV
ncbi:AMP-binding enzyme domain-containing protein [Sarocladium implicatum]|nr:AMP-binding enzyme domain-containing protein [Sarocladium implicatum]